MKFKLSNLRPLTVRTHLAVAAASVLLAPRVQGDTILNFDSRPQGQNQGADIIQTFGDAATSSSAGVEVVGFGTPNIGLTWQGTGGTWQYYIDSVWAAAQLDSSDVGDRHELVFT